MSQRRLVQIYITDTNENVPLNKFILHKSDPLTTDDTDQELFHAIRVQDLLDKHNKERVKIVDADATRREGKPVHLEAARVRDLSMRVHTIFQF